MRTLLLILALCVSSQAANFVLLTSGSNNAPAGVTINTTGADFLVAIVSSSASNPLLNDSKAGNTWNNFNSNSYVYGTTRVSLFYCDHPAAVGTSHNLWFNTTGGTGWVYFLAFSGSLDPSFDFQTGGAGSGTPGSLFPAGTNELIISGFSTSVTTTAANIDASMTKLYSNVAAGGFLGGGVAYKIQTAVVTVNPTWTHAGAANIASFRSTSSVDTPKPAKRKLIAQ